MAVSESVRKTKPADIPLAGVTRIACPKCHKATPCHLGDGWTLTFCAKCRLWYRTGKEIFSLHLKPRPLSLLIDLQGLMRIHCPHCKRTTKVYLGGGWALMWCESCDLWHRISNDIIPSELIQIDKNLIPAETEKE